MNSLPALAESIVSAPEQVAQEALGRLGEWAPRIRRMVGQMNQAPWFSRLGDPSDYANGAAHLRSLKRGPLRRVKSVGDFASALSLRRDELTIDDQIWELLAKLGKDQNLLEIMGAAEDYWIARFNFEFTSPQISQDQIDELLPFIRSDIVGSLREAVLGDGVGIYYFSDALFWYKRGHLRCGLEDGYELIY